MEAPRLSDVARQFAIVFTAIFQIYASYVQGSQNGVIAQEIRSLVLPATYAFAIWGPIFLLCLVYAIYQALPQHRTSPALRASGWWAAGAFLANGVWIYAFTSRQFVLAQFIIIAGWLCATSAFLLYARAVTSDRAASIDQWIIGPAFGLLAGWLTAASFVGLAGTLVAVGLAAEGAAAERGAAALLLAAAGVGVGIILRAKPGFSAAWVAYGAAVLWALLAIVVEHRSDSLLVAGAAIVGMALIVVVMVLPSGQVNPVRSPA
jgi:hypothetical protein